jgi:hypothetical protein
MAMILTRDTLPLDTLAMDDRQLDAAIRAADAAANAATIAETLRAERERRRAEVRARTAERAALVGSLRAQVDEHRARFLSLLRDLDGTPPDEARALVEAAYVCGRQWFALANGLAGALGERLRVTWDGSAQLELHAPRAFAAFWARVGARPPALTAEQQPWLSDLARLRELIRQEAR